MKRDGFLRDGAQIRSKLHKVGRGHRLGCDLIETRGGSRPETSFKTWREWALVRGKEHNHGL